MSIPRRRRLIGIAALLMLAVAVFYGAGAALAADAPAEPAAHGDHGEPADPAPGVPAGAGEHLPESEAAAADGAGTHAGADAGEHGGAENNFLGLPRALWLTANLLLFLGVLGYFLVPPVNRFLDARGEEIRRNLELARTQALATGSMRDSLAVRVAALEREMQELVARAQTDGARERDEVLAQAARERARLLAQTREEIAHRLSQARAELTAYTATLAADLARQRVEREITPEDRRRLFDENLRRLDRIAATSIEDRA